MILLRVVYEHVVGSDTILQWWFCRWVVSNSCDPMDRGSWQATIYRIFQVKNSGVGFHALLQSIFPTQGSDPGLLHCRQILHQPTYQGSPLLCSREIIYGRWESEQASAVHIFGCLDESGVSTYFITTKVPDHVYKLKKRKKKKGWDWRLRRGNGSWWVKL